MTYKVGQTINLPGDEILGCVAEPVEILEVHENGLLLVRQLTDINGEPGDFEVDSTDLRPVFPS